MYLRTRAERENLQTMRDAGNLIVIQKEEIRNTIASPVIGEGLPADTNSQIIIQKMSNQGIITQCINQKRESNEANNPVVIKKRATIVTIAEMAIKKVKNSSAAREMVSLKDTCRDTNACIEISTKPIKPNKYEETFKKASIVFADRETETFTFPFKTLF